uniref:Uncharacterized protein n=1 Tax=Lepeophtheirus salmonis TaxID=72036 RepID=A0A0K2UDB6_LEPSM
MGKRRLCEIEERSQEMMLKDYFHGLQFKTLTLDKHQPKKNAGTRDNSHRKNQPIHLLKLN